MIFPLVIAAVAAVLYIVIGMYQSLELQSSIHIALRKECGELSQTVYRAEETISYPVKKEWRGIRPIVRTEQEREGRAYLIDEPELIRVLSVRGEESK